jgi:hypothetical protein
MFSMALPSRGALALEPAPALPSCGGQHAGLMSSASRVPIELHRLEMVLRFLLDVCDRSLDVLVCQPKNLVLDRVAIAQPEVWKF